MRDEDHDPRCAVAHGAAPAAGPASADGAGPGAERGRVLVAVFASPVAEYLVRYGADLGLHRVLLEPDAERAQTRRFPGDVPVVTAPPPDLDDTADVVVTEHHRAELGPVLRDLLALPVRWIGVMGSPRHEGPHVKALTELGVPAAQIARVQRPIGLDIGSRTPPEIAIATLAGLLADRNGRPGGFFRRSSGSS